MPPWKSFLSILIDGEERAFQGSGLDVVKVLPPSFCWPVLSHVAKITATEHTDRETVMTSNGGLTRRIVLGLKSLFPKSETVANSNAGRARRVCN